VPVTPERVAKAKKSRRGAEKALSAFPETPLSAATSGRIEETSEETPRREARLMRTRRLIMAAVRVWELKRGLPRINARLGSAFQSTGHDQRRPDCGSG
jgi:hypothetical protein